MAIACPDCGLIQTIPPLPRGGLAVCPACENRLERTAGRSLDAALACALATLLLLIPANFLTFLEIHYAGISRQSVLGSGIAVLWQQGWIGLAGLSALFVILLPGIRLGLIVAILGSLRLGWRPDWAGRAFRWATRLDFWAMPDVFLIACAIGYSRIEAFVPVEIGAGGWCFMAAAFLSMLTRAAVDRRRIWRTIAPDSPAPSGEPAISCTCCDLVAPLAAERRPCPRCGARLQARKPEAVIRTLALVLAGLLLYGPSNVYPMQVVLLFGSSTGTTIYSGIEQLISAHLWPLAVLIFTTSIAIPFVKLAGLGWFSLSVMRGWRRALVNRTKLHRAINEIGRWSNIDPFTLVVFTPLMQLGGALHVTAGLGAPCFMAVVVLTMIASETFDARLMWDAAERHR